MKALFFDWDGTIADSHQGIVKSLQAMVQEQGLVPLKAQEYLQFIGPPLPESLQRFYPDLTPGAIDAAVRSFQGFYQQDGIFAFSFYPHIREVLTELKANGAALYVASAKPERMLRRLEAQFDLAQYFDGIYGASDDERTRAAKADILRYALTQTQASPADAVMIGDRNTDMTGGTANTTEILGVTYGFGTAAELTAAGATVLVASPREIPDGLARLG